MIDDYKKAMDRVKTDDAYKAKFIESLETKQQRKKTLRLLPSSRLATAASLALVVYCTLLFFIRQPEDAKLRLAPRYDSGKPTYTQSANNVVYFTFEGFEGENSPSSKAVMLLSYESDYTLANLLEDYYPVLAGETDSTVTINDGMVDSFLGEQADGKKEINVYINDCEVMNLEHKLLSECFNSDENVYFKVSVE